ncbi:hypothetical protein RYA05_01880 [Pseudomonas syringae pv. actinidiae]|nr:hypothetical protein [Pseudomonas syringae pv. actinidiae]
MSKTHAVITTFRNMIVLQSKRVKASARHHHTAAATPATLGISEGALKLLASVNKTERPTLNLVFSKSDNDSLDLCWEGSSIEIIDPATSKLPVSFNVPEGAFRIIHDVTSAKARQTTTSYLDQQADNSGECELCDGTGTLHVESPFKLGTLRLTSPIPCHVCRKTGTDKNALLKMGKGVRGFKDRLTGDRPSFAKFRPDVLLDRAVMMAAIIASNNFSDENEQLLNIELTEQNNGSYRITNAFENSRFTPFSEGMITRYLIDHCPEIGSELLDKFGPTSKGAGVVEAIITRAHVEKISSEASQWRSFETTINKMLRDEGETGSINFYKVYFLGGLHSAIDAAKQADGNNAVA